MWSTSGRRTFSGAKRNSVSRKSSQSKSRCAAVRVSACCLSWSFETPTPLETSVAFAWVLWLSGGHRRRASVVCILGAGQRSGCVAIPLASFTGRLPAHVLEPSTRENPVPWAIPNGCDTREPAAKNCLSISPLAYRARGRPPFSAFGSCGALDTCVSQFSQMCVRALSFCRNHRPADVRLRLFPALACKWLR